MGEREVAFLPRHGTRHEFSPHTVPYRANMWALRAVGAPGFAPCAVGSLTADLGPGAIVVPDQLVDRTSGREQTYFDSAGIHVEFADPYCPGCARCPCSPAPLTAAPWWWYRVRDSRPAPKAVGMRRRVSPWST